MRKSLVENPEGKRNVEKGIQVCSLKDNIRRDPKRTGCAVAELLEACKPEGRGFDSRQDHWDYFNDSFFSRTIFLRST
jgi:hypothetical protein